MRKMFALLSLLVVFSMALAACGGGAPAPTDAAAPAGTEAAVATEAAASGPTSQYIGSGVLDGNGIPVDFFADVHVRKGFSYSFDWDTFITDVLQGEGVQSFQLPLAGMPGYEAKAEHYTLSIEKATEEFKLADLDHDGIAAGDDPEGDVWTTGFRLQMLYNQGNTTRQTIAEILAANLSTVNELFVVEVLGLPWPAYLAAQRGGTIPTMTAGWQEDIHDPHNWYQPYTTGAYGGRQNMPQEMKDQFKAMLDQGVAETDPAKRDAIYKEMNKMYFDLVPGAILTSGISHGYEQRWVEGRVYNPIMSGDYYYGVSKTAEAKDPTIFNNVTFGDLEVLDPARVYDTSSGEIVQNTYETLVFYDGGATDKFVPMLATELPTVSEDGKTYTFKIREGVKFHNGDVMTPSDVAWSFQRGILQGGTSSPQFLLSEPFLGVGVDDIAAVVDPEGSVYDDRALMQAFDPAALKAACEKVTSAIVADDAAGTVTMTLASAWGPFLPTIAQTWGSVMNKNWSVEKGAWDGSCDTWQNFYVSEPDINPFTETNGTGPFKLDVWTKGEEIVLVRNDDYWREPAKLERVNFKLVDEWGTRFAMVQAGDADIVAVNLEDTPQADKLVGEVRFFNIDANEYDAAVPLCSIDESLTGPAKFIPCAGGEAGTGGALRLLIGRPSIVKSVIIYNFAIK